MPHVDDRLQDAAFEENCLSFNIMHVIYLQFTHSNAPERQC